MNDFRKPDAAPAPADPVTPPPAKRAVPISEQIETMRALLLQQMALQHEAQRKQIEELRVALFAALGVGDAADR